jgi:hypothetical protein
MRCQLRHTSLLSKRNDALFKLRIERTRSQKSEGSNVPAILKFEFAAPKKLVLLSENLVLLREDVDEQEFETRKRER